MGIEQPQLLTAVNRVERVVNVERDPSGNLVEGRCLLYTSARRGQRALPVSKAQDSTSYGLILLFRQRCRERYGALPLRELDP